MEQTNGIKTWQWVVTVVIIIVLVILGYNMFKGSSTPTTSNTDDTTPTSSTAIKSNVNSISVLDQAPGNIVYVSSVQFAKPGFVVIKKNNNGTPGDVIGYKYFDKGIYPGQITLTTPTIDGDMYYAVLHLDDGDKKFDLNKDTVIKDASGKDIMKLFKVTINPEEIKG